MSYQFEDDSALEELLNQQLDRKRQRPRVSGDRPTTMTSRPSTTKSVQRSSNIPTVVGPRPSTALNKLADVDDQQTSVFNSSSVSKSKLASWLDGKGSKPVEAEVPAMLETLNLDNLDETGHFDLNGRPIEDTLSEDHLQEMSKQRLIKLIVGEIVPKLKNLRQMSSEQSSGVVAQLKDELQFEKNKVMSLETRYMEQTKQVEARWMQLNKHLESRLELNENELNLAGERHRNLIAQLETEHKQQIDKLREGYQAKLAEEKLQFEETLKRREDLHNIELESKLKVNCDLVKLETVFDEWHKMIQTTIRELNLQFKSVENLLDKQTIEINGTNSEIVKKSKELGEHYDKFELQGEQLSLLAREMNEILPRFSRLQQENESLVKQTNVQLGEFLKRNDQLRLKEQEMEKIKDKLASDGIKLGEDRFELALSQNRLAYKEERLAELVQSNELQESKLAEQRRNQMEQDARLGALQLNLENKSNELKQQNYDLHLTRKKLTEEAERLNKLELELVGGRKSVEDQFAKVQDEGRKLVDLRDRSRKELNQLRRLQKSLVCSLCLDRLFKGSDSNHQSFKAASHNDKSDDNKWMDKVVDLDLALDEMNTIEVAEQAKDRPAVLLKRHQPDRRKQNFELELAKLSRYIDLDSKQLEVENKYVELLSIN